MSGASAQAWWIVRAAMKLAAIGVLSLASLAYAQEPSAQYSIGSWGHKDDMTSTFVFSIAQTGDGFLWLGTEDGLVRFDGIQFTQWHPAMPSDQLLGEVRALDLSPDGELMLGAGSMLGAIKRNGAFAPTHLDSEVLSIQNAADGSLWVATNAALWHLAGDTLEATDPPTALPDKWVSGPLESQHGRAWIATQAGLFYVDAGRLVQAASGRAWLLIAPGGHAAWIDEAGNLHDLETREVIGRNSALAPFSSIITTALTEDCSGS
jgi:ligand-binding sensor domain-containing protein